MQKADETPLVSVVTTTYNKFQYLRDNIDSVLVQTYPAIEMVISDDCSHSFPREEVESYIDANKGPNIKRVVINQNARNLGTVQNCARCRELAGGEVIMGLAADDMFADENVVADVAARLTQTNDGIVTCKRRCITRDGSSVLGDVPTRRETHWLKELPPSEMFKRLSCCGWALSGASTYYTRDFYFEHGGFDASYRYTEDYPFFLRLLREGVRIPFWDRATVLYRVGGGVSTSETPAARRRFIDDRLHYMRHEIVPYAGGFSFIAKQQVKARLAMFEREKTRPDEGRLVSYARSFATNPVGTAANVYQQLRYKRILRKAVD